jgi:hypothetical protein
MECGLRVYPIDVEDWHLPKLFQSGEGGADGAWWEMPLRIRVALHDHLQELIEWRAVSSHENCANERIK